MSLPTLSKQIKMYLFKQKLPLVRKEAESMLGIRLVQKLNVQNLFKGSKMSRQAHPVVGDTLVYDNLLPIIFELHELKTVWLHLKKLVIKLGTFSSKLSLIFIE